MMTLTNIFNLSLCFLHKSIRFALAWDYDMCVYEKF